MSSDTGHEGTHDPSSSTHHQPTDTSPLAELAPHHYAMLTQESGISHEMIVARGYRTATQKRELEDLGFTPAQRRVPALVLPIHGVGGIVVNHQIRPDRPRRGRDGHVIKYETPFDSRMMLDVPPCVHHHLDNPQVPLFITEGIKKGDALAARSTEAMPFAVAPLMGVWNWRGTNEHGGKAPVPCWYSVALNDRLIYIVFDGDVMVKRQVWYALAALKSFLESRGSQIRLVYLPQTLDGKKCGVDDYLVAGHTISDLKEISTTKLLPPPLLDVPVAPRMPYAATEHGLIMHRLTRDGEITVPLANFSATIATDIVEDNGAERRRRVEIEARLGQRTARFTIAASAFAGMSWVVERLGSEAIIMPGVALKDHCRTAIQMLSKNTAHRTVYTHIGWRQLDDTWCFLHGAGAIGPSGPVADVDVALSDGLQRYVLPEPTLDEEELREAVRRSLGLLEVAPDEIAVPIYMSVWRAVLDAAPFSLYLVGPTGAGKSALAALAQQHFGPEMDGHRLPGSWTSTANALGELQFLAKDALLTIDDFCPTGSQPDQQRLHRDADRVFRNQGNGAGRQRMRSEGGLQAPKPPRGMILATGEDLPRGQSLRARLLVIEMQADSLQWDGLGPCQMAAAEGDYAMALSGFLHWLAPQYGTLQETMPGEVIRLRQQTQQAGHKRTADIAAQLLFGWDVFLTFAYQMGAISEDERQSYTQRGWSALATAAQAQAELQYSENPVDRFFVLLQAVLSSGQAHLADRESNHIPAVDADHYGWRNLATRASASGVPSDVDPLEPDSWRPQGARVGWLDDGYLYLTPDATYAAVVQMAREQGETFTLTQRTLWKRLDERGMLTREAEQRHYTRRISVHGKRERVVCVPRQNYETPSEKSGPSGPSGPGRHKSLINSELKNESAGPLSKSQNPEWSKWSTPNGTAGPLGPLRNQQNPEWSSHVHSEDVQNQRDTNEWTTWTTWTTNLTPPSKRGDTRTPFSEPAASCPKCLARRLDTTGSYKLCLACGHKWQVEKEDES